MVTDPSAICEHDEKTVWRCPRLGGSVPFKYCRTLTQGLPCPSIQTCWERLIDVESFLNGHYSVEQLNAAWKQQTKPPKVDQLLDLIQKAKDAQSENP